MRGSTFFISMAVCLSFSSVLGKECIKRASKQKNVMFVNLKTIKTDGTAVAYIENGACPVKIADKDASFDEEDRHHQSYKVTLGNGAKCAVEGWDTGPTTMECLRNGKDDEIERSYVDALYKPQPCPKGCDAECKAIDPDWNKNALMMFAFKWDAKPKQNKPKESITLTTTVGPKVTGKLRPVVRF